MTDIKISLKSWSLNLHTIYQFKIDLHFWIKTMNAFLILMHTYSSFHFISFNSLERSMVDQLNSHQKCQFEQCFNVVNMVMLWFDPIYIFICHFLARLSSQFQTSISANWIEILYEKDNK